MKNKIITLLSIALIISVGIIASNLAEKKIETAREEARVKTFQDVGDAVRSTGNVVIPYTYTKDGEEVKVSIRLIVPQVVTPTE